MEYCLRYHTIATKSRLIRFIVFVWVTAAASSAASSLVHEIDTEDSGVLLYRIFLIGCTVTMLASSFWVEHVRKTHLREIRQRNLYFGVNGEEYNALVSLGRFIVEIIRLNMVTALLILTSAVSALLSISTRENDQKDMKLVDSGGISITALADLIYLISNPFVYMLVMSDLRKHYVRCFRAIRQLLRQRVQRVHPLVESSVESS